MDAAPGNWALSVEYTYNDAENKSDGAVTDKVAGVAENQFVAGISALVPFINVRMDLREFIWTKFMRSCHCRPAGHGNHQHIGLLFRQSPPGQRIQRKH